MNYKNFSKSKKIEFVRKDNSKGTVDTKYFIDAIDTFNNYLKTFEEIELPIGQVLGLRNLSSFIGELYNISVCKVSKTKIKKNPHQDGYPDLLIMDKIGKNAWNKFKNRMHEKEPFSYFETGGIEVKATCGDLKSGKWFTEKNIKKPDLGDPRLEYVTGYNWKSHHRFTNNLLGIIWDFVNNTPTIISIMYSNDLEMSDWGETVKPKEGGGRTTSVSIMNKKGISKMYKGMILLLDEDTYSSEKLIQRLSK